MTRSDLEYLEKEIRKELAHREALGGIDFNAGVILLLLKAVYKITQHLLEKAPRTRDKAS